jgi:hypothetical protein
MVLLVAPFDPPCRQSPELLLNPVVIARSQEEKVLIEGSVNSVRISVRIKKSDELDVVLSRRFLRFLTQRAENFVILRRKPIEVRLHELINYYVCFVSE